jgi:hypothetical protein
MSGGDWKEMFHAATSGDVALVEFHLGQGVDPNFAHAEFLELPLVASILAGQEGAAHLLLDHGAIPALVSPADGITALQAARRVAMTSVVDRLAGG